MTAIEYTHHMDCISETCSMNSIELSTISIRIMLNKVSITGIFSSPPTNNIPMLISYSFQTTIAQTCTSRIDILKYLDKNSNLAIKP